jgi:putative transposase
MLRIRTDAWCNNQERIGYHKTSSLLTALKKEEQYKWLNEVSCVPTQQALRHLQSSYQNFWSKRTKYPTFKKKHHKQSAEYTASAFKWNGTDLTLAKHNKSLNIVWSREIPKEAKVTTVCISKDYYGRYFVSLLCNDLVQLKEEVQSKIGIDLGLDSFAVLSTGEKIKAPQYFRKYEKKLAKRQRILARKQKGSILRQKAKLKVAKIHAKIADSRTDFLHALRKLSTRLINENQVIAVESLSVKNMQKNRRLAKSIGDAGWSEFLRQLTYKALWYGRKLIGIDKWYPTSKRCNICGYTLEKLKLSTRHWTCPECKTEHDRDINASRNVLAVGLAVLANGESVSPVCI